MQIFKSLPDWQNFRKTLKTQTLGFAPTMGNLHPGHISLFTTSKQENDVTASSLFVNPTQFNNPEDYQHYPRTLETDLSLMESIGIDFCILPTQEDLYADHYHYQIQEHHFSQKLEGEQRPGHFTGVLTVVMKLLNLVKPHHAYFGEKDYQQYALIKGMAEAFFLDTHIRLCPTIREPSGLAYSSRNNRLNLQEKQLAEKFAKIFHQDTDCEEIKAQLAKQGIEIDYLSIHNDRKYAAVKIGNVRLIDNVDLKKTD